MELKYIPSNHSQTVLRLSGDRNQVFLAEGLFEKNFLIAKVIERLAGNEFILNFSGKLIRLKSDVNLFLGETLNLRVKKGNQQVQLEIDKRSTGLEKGGSSVENAWAKAYFSPLKALNKAFDPIQSEVALNKILQFLDVFFPGIEWNKETPYFNWKFEDSEAAGFLGKLKDSFGFYFNFQSKSIGEVNSYFQWKKNDLSDLILHCVFDKLSVYMLATEKLVELEKILSSYSIDTENIIFHYATVYQERGEWVV